MRGGGGRETYIHQRDELIGESDPHVAVARRDGVLPVNNCKAEDSFSVVRESKGEGGRERDETKRRDEEH
jgi:hypothetical protein